MATTKAIDLINVEVIADTISGMLDKQIKFAPYAKIDTTLVGQAGDTITRPKYAYIGPAEDLQEGVPMDTSKLSMTTTKVTVKEAGKAIEISEKAILTNVNGTVEEAEKQLGLSITDKLDIDYVNTLNETKLIFNGEINTVNIMDAIDLFGDEDEEDYVLFIHTDDYRTIYKEMVVGNTFLSINQLAELLGLKAIERTKRIEKGTAFIQKQDAVEIVYKKRPEVDKDGDILARTVVLVGNTFYVTNLYNEGGVVKIETTKE